MKSFTLNISSPDGSLFRGDIILLALRGAEGDLAILSDHIPFVTSVQPGEFHIELEDEVRYGTSTGGILTVSTNEAVFLTSSVEWKTNE